MTLRVALAHDVLAARAGGERVLLALSRAFPQAPLHTLIHEPAATFSNFQDQRTETSWLNRYAWLRKNYRVAAPLAALSFASRQIDAAVTICSSSGLSHHARTSGAKIVYCHTPARWLHDTETYLQGFNTTVQVAVRSAAPPLRWLDRRAMQTADRVVANSHQVAEEIGAVYGIDAQVIAPCSTFDLDGPVQALPNVAADFVLSPARPLGYKRLDVLIEAARALPDRTFVHVGDAPHRQQVFANAPDNIISFGAVSDAQLRWAYRNASVVALTCAEDFGLVPLEAAASGVHTVAPNARGIRDHDSTHLTPYLFASASELTQAIESAPPPTRTSTPALLGQERFAAEIYAVVNEFA